MEKTVQLHIPESVVEAMEAAAQADGKTPDELYNDAAQRYLAHRQLQKLGVYGRERARRLGYTEDDVESLIAETRKSRVSSR